MRKFERKERVMVRCKCDVSNDRLVGSVLQQSNENDARISRA